MSAAKKKTPRAVESVVKPSEEVSVPTVSSKALPAGWRVLEDEPLPRPTAWPGALAFAVTFLLWGIISSPFIGGVGALLFILSIAGWIGDIRNEARSHH